MNKFTLSNITEAQLINTAFNKNYLSDNKILSLFNTIDDTTIHISGELNKSIGDLSLSGTLTLSSTLNLASKSTFIMTDNPVWNANFASHSGYLQCSQGKYNEFRPLGQSGVYIKPTKVGGCIGAKVFCILAGNNTDTYGEIKLSGDISSLINAYENELNNDMWTYVTWSLGYEGYGEGCKYTINFDETKKRYEEDLTNNILSAHWVVLNQQLGIPYTLGFKNKSEADMIQMWNDLETDEEECIFYSPIAPWVGNLICPIMHGQHSEGTVTRAINRGTHAEGKFTLADCRYSHSEGSQTIAAGCGAHAEGLNTFANEYAHSEGGQTVANGNYSHAEGQYTEANGNQSHVQNYSCKANGDNSTACGYNATAQGQNTFCWNGQTKAYGTNLTAAGLFCINPVKGINGIYIGYQTLSDIISAAVEAEVKKQLNS